MAVLTDNMWKMKPNIPLAKQLAKRDIPALVYDAVNLEGVAMTLPEVQTILDGITVGGHRISDQNMAINQARAWEFIFDLVDQGEFQFNKETALKVHKIAGKEEALTGSEYQPPASDELDAKWREVESQVNNESDVYDQAITAFLQIR